MQATITRENRENPVKSAQTRQEMEAMLAWMEDKKSAYLKVRSKSPEKNRDKSKDLPTARGQEWILLVDSNPLMTEISVRMLEHLGYCVMTATDGDEALKIVRAGSGLFRLVIADANLPGIDSAELTRRLLMIRPDLPILLCSGYGEWNRTGRGCAAGAHAFCLKPMPIVEMAGRVRRLIDKAA